MLNRRVFCSTALVLLAASSALAGANPRHTDDFGHEFIRIGKPGNRAALPEERYFNQRFEKLGRVNYRYRIAKTEVTATNWLEFVNAYWPIWEANGGARGDNGFTSQWIFHNNSNPAQNPSYVIGTNSEHLAIAVKWEVAARYANWLTNGKINEEWAFEAGAYDTSTFAPHPDGGYTHQPEHTPGSRFWLPSVDEWAKAAHYDPDRYGEDQEGYWTQKGSQQTPLTPGLPENGGETSAGDFLPLGHEMRIPVGSYPTITSPWGLLDTSGGADEWTETVRFFYDDHDAHDGRHYILGSEAGDGDFEYIDKDVIDWYLNAGFPASTAAGFRLASRVPAPSTAILSIGLLAMASRRKGRD